MVELSCCKSSEGPTPGGRTQARTGRRRGRRLGWQERRRGQDDGCCRRAGSAQVFGQYCSGSTVRGSTFDRIDAITPTGDSAVSAFDYLQEFPHQLLVPGLQTRNRFGGKLTDQVAGTWEGANAEPRSKLAMTRTRTRD